MDRELPRRRGADAMNAGAWRLAGFNDDACALIMNFLCLAAPESGNFSMNTPQSSCGVFIQREEIRSNHGGPGFAHKPAHPHATIQDIASSLSILRLHTQHTPSNTAIETQWYSNFPPQPHPQSPPPWTQ